MRKISDLSKYYFIASSAILALLVVFAIGLYIGSERNAAFDFIKGFKDNLTATLNRFEQATGHPVHFLQPAQYQGSGVTVNRHGDDDTLILLVGFFDGSNALRLIRRDGTLVADWPTRFSEYFLQAYHMHKPPQTDLNIDLHGALINPDGSVVFNFEYGGMVKLSRCGEVIWTLKYPTHHSVEKAQNGGYWVPGRRALKARTGPYPPFMSQNHQDDYLEDIILKVNEDGVIIEQIPILKLLYENGLEPILTATGYAFLEHHNPEKQITHLNKVAELSPAMAEAYNGFEAGDLLVSLRNYNLVFVFDPHQQRIKWHQTGPWRRQHDPDFNPDGTITIYNNNIYRTALDDDHRLKPDIPKVSQIIRINPDNGDYATIYGDRQGEEFLSVLRGTHQATAAGGLLITSSEGGRAFEVDANGMLIWQYINRYDADQVVEINGATLYPDSYFDVADWHCPSSR